MSKTKKLGIWLVSVVALSPLAYSLAYYIPLWVGEPPMKTHPIVMAIVGVVTTVIVVLPLYMLDALWQREAKS